MIDKLTEEALALSQVAAITEVLEDVCRITDMGFAAVARVTEDRWIACQVLDKIEFGLNPGDELEIKTTICDEIRQSGQRVIIDHVDQDIEWQTHHTPMLYGFKSYASLPITAPDGTFFGTLCAIDPRSRSLKGNETLAALQHCAERVQVILADTFA
ncbi:GAF domain-containing protein [Sphingobium sp. SCG-1]|uniref:GAF domain-containing protein n=1 Tax=Sphingobium sp. SCG-1 TaxID=2072936 RepID=UPI000CD6A269|nr:GAF domain-containing protein [Sphingobium sp. SCG-1]AUW58082.1 GAF domain-containing protein [Sphingobium sp. SCG-1]